MFIKFFSICSYFVYLCNSNVDKSQYQISLSLLFLKKRGGGGQGLIYTLFLIPLLTLLGVDLVVWWS